MITMQLHMLSFQSIYNSCLQHFLKTVSCKIWARCAHSYDCTVASGVLHCVQTVPSLGSLNRLA